MPDADAPTESNVGLATQIAEQIRLMIVRGTLAPQVHLGQVELANRFGVSRIPIREALKLLAAESLIVHDPNRGYFVAALSSEEAAQLYRLRHLVERELLLTLQWPSPAQLSEMTTRLQKLESLVEDNARRDWAQQHTELHREVLNLSTEKTIVREAERLWALTDRYRSLLSLPMDPKQAKGRMLYRRALIAALKEQDRDALIREFERGREDAVTQVLQVLKNRGL